MYFILIRVRRVSLSFLTLIGFRTITELQTIGFILSFVFHVLVLCISHALTLGLTLGLETFCKTTVMVRGFESLVRLDSLIDSSMRPL